MGCMAWILGIILFVICPPLGIIVLAIGIILTILEALGMTLGCLGGLFTIPFMKDEGDES